LTRRAPVQQKGTAISAEAQSAPVPYPSVLALCSDLISIDSSNYGSGEGNERAAADYVVTVLSSAGYEPTILESAPGRANVLLRVAGSDPGLDALLVHGHLDIVPVEAEQWSVNPFAGEIRDGYLWGRGATDMKDMVANMLNTLLRWAETGTGPRRDILFAFVADEEADGNLGSHWLVGNHPDWFAGITAAIGEGGGVPIEQRDDSGEVRRFYPVAVAERGIHHMRVRATGPSGHGSRPEAENAVTNLVQALARLVEHPWPVALIPSSRAFLEITTTALGVEADLSTPSGVDAAIDSIGVLRANVRPASRCSVNVTVLKAGYKVNVIPGVAEAQIDVRSVPGTEQALISEIVDLLGPLVTVEFISNRAGVSAPLDSEWYRSIGDAILAYDADAIVVPSCLGGGTDAKAFSTLGIDCYGFAPLGRDPEGRTGSGMHGVDERVPVAALEIGASILQKFLTEA
jgi:acetylornithine deacetylase/succinyl-diaminopimelate desuccinylase-like protein